MKLIEKKCPNCGASLSFDENDKSCKCDYCKRVFEIERDTKLSTNDFAEQFNLSELKTPLKLASTIAVGSYAFSVIFSVIIFIVVFGLIGFGVYHGIKSQKQFDSSYKEESSLNDNPLEEEEKLLTDISELSNRAFDSIDSKATGKISHTGEGINNAYHSYSITGNITREKLYIAYKEGSNYVIPIYKAIYHDFFHQENQYTVYIPIVFENIEKNVIFSLGNAKLAAPEYYFNLEKTSYTYGYGSFEEAYNSVVQPLEEDYKISEK